MPEGSSPVTPPGTGLWLQLLSGKFIPNSLFDLMFFMPVSCMLFLGVATQAYCQNVEFAVSNLILFKSTLISPGLAIRLNFS